MQNFPRVLLGFVKRLAENLEAFQMSLGICKQILENQSSQIVPVVPYIFAKRRGMFIMNFIRYRTMQNRKIMNSNRRHVAK